MRRTLTHIAVVTLGCRRRRSRPLLLYIRNRIASM